ncbi:MAG: c-type cytochrome [Anaerolineae bacterium]
MKSRTMVIAVVVLVLILVLASCGDIEPTPTPVTPESTATLEAATPTREEPTAPLEETPTAFTETPTVEVEATETPPSEALGEAQLLAAGEQVFSANCAPCHQLTGQGVEGAFPALDGDAFVQSPDPAPVIQVVLNGRRGMPAFGGRLSDEELASVISYIRNAWTNVASLVTGDEVAAAR